MHAEKPGFCEKPGFSPTSAMIACKPNETETR